jgi:hypothetical protein
MGKPQRRLRTSTNSEGLGDSLSCMIELPSQHVIAISGPPDFEEWKKRVSLASDEELKKLQMGALMSLRGMATVICAGAPYIGVVESEMRNRGIKP